MPLFTNTLVACTLILCTNLTGYGTYLYELKYTCTIIHSYLKFVEKEVVAMGARRGGGQLPPLEFENMTSYAAVLQGTFNLSLASSALAIDTLYFNLKQRKKNAQNVDR